jgi:hypothetical protein
MNKAHDAQKAGQPMSATAYLRVPTIFGFHGVYKPLARNLGIVDDKLRLADCGYELLKTWQGERGLDGFLPSAMNKGPGTQLGTLLRIAVEEGLRDGYISRSDSWQGWRLLAEHLVPANIGAREAQYIHQLLLDAKGGTRGEVFRLADQVRRTRAAMDIAERALALDNAAHRAGGAALHTPNSKPQQTLDMAIEVRFLPGSPLFHQHSRTAPST